MVVARFVVAARLIGATDALPRLAMAASLPLVTAVATATPAEASPPVTPSSPPPKAQVEPAQPAVAPVVTATDPPPAEAANRRGARAIYAGLPEVVWQDPPEAREAALWAEISAHNYPEFAASFVPLTISDTKGRKAVFQVGVDCFAVGTEEDWLHVALSGYYAQKVADMFGAHLPTNKLVLAMYEQAAIKLVAHPFDCQSNYGGKWQRSTFAMRLHGDVVQGKVACTRGAKVDEANGRLNPNLGTHAGVCALPPGRHPGVLVSGHVKEVIISHEDLTKRLAFWGFFTSDGRPIQRGFGCPHGPGFADYSHGFRLIGPKVEVDGKDVSYEEVVTNPEYASLVFAEGGQPCRPPKYPPPPAKFYMGH